jgi:hypothetical protein
MTAKPNNWPLTGLTTHEIQDLRDPSNLFFKKECHGLEKYPELKICHFWKVCGC